MKTRINSIKEISIKEFLARQGSYPVKDKGHYGMYNSPLRDDTTPSFKVDYKHNLWYDHGMGKGGSIIDLVMEMEGCSTSQAIKKLEKNYVTAIKIPVFNTTQTYNSKIMEITDIKKLQHPALINYLTDRGIEKYIAENVCKEVHYK